MTTDRATHVGMTLTLKDGSQHEILAEKECHGYGMLDGNSRVGSAKMIAGKFLQFKFMRDGREQWSSPVWFAEVAAGGGISS